MNANQIHDLIANLPGAERVAQGLNDYLENRHTIPACLVRIARPNLTKAGLMEPSPRHDILAELHLYELLASEGNQAHSRYNALIRELISFEHALNHRLNKAS